MNTAKQTEEEMSTPYQFAINNTKAYIRGELNQYNIGRMNGTAVDIFQAAKILAIAFVKDEDDIVADLLKD
jgi:hypothetical protein